MENVTTQNDVIGQTTMYVGSIASCSAGFIWSLDESSIMAIIAIVSAIVGVCGLIFTIWNSNRQYKLTLRQYEEERNDRRAAMGLPSIPPNEGSAA